MKLLVRRTWKELSRKYPQMCLNANLEEVETRVACLKESVKAESDRADLLNEKADKNQAENKLSG